MIPILVRAGAKIIQRLRTNFLEYVVCSAPDMVEFLLQSGARVNSLGLSDETALHSAVKYQPSVVQTLIDAGACVDAPHDMDVWWKSSSQWNTPLHYASEYNPELIPILLEAGANPSLKN